MYEIFQSLLKAKNCTAYQVSKATGIPTAALSAWKQGKYTPKQANIQKIAEFFGVDVSIFYGKAPGSPQEVIKSADVDELLKEAKRANTDDLRATIDYIRRLNKYAEALRNVKGE